MSCSCKEGLDRYSYGASVVDFGPFTTTTQQADPLIRNHAIHWVLCKEAYARQRRYAIEGWVYQPQASSGDTAVYADGNHVIIAFRGTATLVDIHNDIQLSRPGQSCSFEKSKSMSVYVARLLETDPLTLIQLTGHSLGGAIARCVGGRLGLGVVTFNCAAPPSSPAMSYSNQIHYHIVFDIISAWQSSATRIDKRYSPRRFGLLTRFLQKLFYDMAIAPMLKAHEIDNFSNERTGMVIRASDEQRVWHNWFTRLPTVVQRLFLKFTKTEMLPAIPA